jgi:sRNA-binding protein
MTVKPIDLQTNISQMIEVGKNEHARSVSLVEQQHHLDKESEDKSNQVNSKLDETKKAEKTAIREDDSKNKKRESREKKEEKEAESAAKPEKKLVKDEKMGRFIDVLK